MFFLSYVFRYCTSKTKYNKHGGLTECFCTMFIVVCLWLWTLYKYLIYNNCIFLSWTLMLNETKLLKVLLYIELSIKSRLSTCNTWNDHGSYGSMIALDPNNTIGYIIDGSNYTLLMILSVPIIHEKYILATHTHIQYIYIYYIHIFHTISLSSNQI